MSFNISEFQAHVSRRGLAKNNLFFMQITLPASISFIENTITTRELTFLCKSVNLPEMRIVNFGVKPLGFGITESRPTDLNLSNLPAVFMMDSDFGTMKFFHRWMQSIINYNTYDGTTQLDPQEKLPYQIEYKDNYAATIEVLLFSGNDASKVYHYTFGNAFPSQVGAIDTSWENQGEIMNLPVTFEFDRFKLEALELGQIAPSMFNQNGFLSSLSSINGVVQAVSQLRLPNNVQDFINQVTNVNTIFNAL